jgi:hypothetical protein
VLEFRLAHGAADAALWVKTQRIAHCGPLAQLAEQQTLNLRVEGSIPSRLTTFLQFHSRFGFAVRGPSAHCGVTTLD